MEANETIFALRFTCIPPGAAALANDVPIINSDIRPTDRPRVTHNGTRGIIITPNL